jgi:hypothetical protein
VGKLVIAHSSRTKRRAAHHEIVVAVLLATVVVIACEPMTPDRLVSEPVATATLSPPVIPSAGPTPAATPQAATVAATVDFGLDPDFSANAQETVNAFGSLWIPVYGSPHGFLIRIDLASRRVVARIRVGESPGSVAVTGGDVWVANTSGDGSRTYAAENTLSRIDPSTNGVVQSVKVEIGGPIAGGFGAVWVPNFQNGTGDGILQKVSADSGSVVAALPLPGRPVVGCAHLWIIETLVPVQAPEVTVVSAVDPRTGKHIGKWPVTAPGLADPEMIDGECLTAWASQDDPGQTTVGLLDPQSGVVLSWPPVDSRLRLLTGGIWTVPDETTAQAIEPDGTPLGPVFRLPFDPANGPGWLTMVGADGWVITNGAAIHLGPLAP